MVTINLWNIALLFLGCFAIWGVLPQDYREEIGSIVGVIVEVIWIIVWIVLFPVLGYSVVIQ